LFHHFLPFCFRLLLLIPSGTVQIFQNNLNISKFHSDTN
jgi:hypothetical protein